MTMSLIYVKDTAQNSADLENKEKCNEGWLPNHELNEDNRHAKSGQGKKWGLNPTQRPPCN